MTSWSSQKVLFDAAFQTFGSVDVVLPNAGVSLLHPFVDVDDNGDRSSFFASLKADPSLCLNLRSFACFGVPGGSCQTQPQDDRYQPLCRPVLLRPRIPLLCPPCPCPILSNPSSSSCRSLQSARTNRVDGIPLRYLARIDRILSLESRRPGDSERSEGKVQRGRHRVRDGRPLFC